MVGLLSLSNELLAQVFSSSDTIQSAATLSEVNKRMNSIWVTHSNQILTNILSTQIVEYNAAKDIAILEEIWIKKNAELASETSGRPRVRLYLSTLLHNAKLATQARKACMLWLHERNPSYCPTHCSFAKYHVAYYQMRKIVLVLEYPEFQLPNVIDSTIGGYSANTTFTIADANVASTLADLNMFLHIDDLRHKAAQRSYSLEQRMPRAQRRSSFEDANNPREQTVAKAEKNQKPLRHDFALLYWTPLADYYSYVMDATLDRFKEVFRVMNERERDAQKTLDAADNAPV
jgi:hypothetical protein